MRKLYLATFFISAILCMGSISARSPSAPDSYVYIISPANGEVVSSPVLVRFGLHGMGVAPAGADIKNTGHHHLLIDVAELPKADLPIPSDKHHKHFGKGQTEALIELTPGKHTLQLLFADYSHTLHDPVIKSEPVTIIVKD